MSIDETTEKNSNASNKLSIYFQPVVDDCEAFLFGDFTNEDHDKYFTKDGVQNIGVEFICDFFNTSKTWVEDCSKQKIEDIEIPYLEEYEKTRDEVQSELCIDGEFNESESVSIITNNDETIEFSNEYNKKSNNKIENNNNAKIEKHLHKKENQNGETKINIQKPPASWASLFKKDNTPQNDTNLINHNDNSKKTVEIFSVQINSSVEKSEDDKLSLISIDKDVRACQLVEVIGTLVPCYSRHHLQLRGLINRGNWCYINTVLQALHGIAPISHFYKSLKQFLNKNSYTSTPITDSMISFFNEFEPINPKIPLKKQSEDLRAGSAFEPKYVYDVLPVMKTSLSEKGRQEDAEEFLSFLLNGIHDELVTLMKLKSKNNTIVNGSCDQHHHSTNHDDEELTEKDEESWEHVGRKNKSSTLRKAVVEDSFIKQIFGGVIRSSVLQTGAKESTTLQPFFTLQLDIQSEKITTLKEAIESYFSKESLHGFTCSKTNTEVEASRRISIEELPLYLIFHLKYFVYDRKGGSLKLHKNIEIPVELEIPKDVLSPNLKTRAANIRNYRLYAVVYHHGNNAAGGHYTAAVHHGNPFGWVNFDDNIIKTVNVNQVLKYHQGCVPYLLFYERVLTR